jgi:hypothetical protein
MNKYWFIIISLVLLIPLVQAGNFSSDKAFQWLISKSGSDGSYNNDITTVTFATMALRESGASLQAEKSFTWLKTQESTSHCFPKTNCKTKDTAFALWTYSNFNEDIEDIENWLDNAQTSSVTGGNWWLEVATTNSGICKLSYESSNKTKTFNITVDKGHFPTCGNTTFLNLNSCLEQGLITKNPFLQLNVDCDALGGSLIIALIYNTGNSYYIIDEGYTSKTILHINNGCFGQVSKGPCNIETTLYINWILSQINSEISNLPYLEDNYDKNNPKHASLLYLITKEEPYINDLTLLQKSDGSFSKLVYDTSLAILALKEASLSTELENATTWLQNKQLADGSWNNNILDTAIALYAAFTETNPELPSCTDGICNGDEDCVSNLEITTPDCGGSCPITCEEVECDKDSDCDPGYECQAYICVKKQVSEKCTSDLDCDYGYSCTNGDCVEKILTECTSDSECVIGEECQSGSCVPKETVECTLDLDCATDEQCKNGECTKEEIAEECTSDSDCGSGLICTEGVCTTKKTTSILWIIIILIILIALGIGGYFLYQKYYKTTSSTKRPEFRPFTSKLQPRTTQTKVQIPYKKGPTIKSRIEEELDKSIKEAKKLLGKK